MPPKRPTEWASPSVILAVAAMALTAYAAYNTTKTGYDVKIAQLELRVDMLERMMRGGAR